MPKVVDSSSNEEASATQAGQHAARAADASELEAAHGQQRHALIATAAYYLAERRGFAPGCELEDWLAAEAEVDAQLKPA